MPKLTIDGQEVEVPPGSTVLQACEAAGREIPVFCFHPRLNIAGNCRMCLVEVAKMPKPQASCALPVAEGMAVITDSPAVHKARKGVLELLLINHPLDCPICDQGGECDLQDLTLFYGPDQSRFAENKRPVADKYMGPLISTHMTRCIHCTRCIRFISEVAGVEELGAVHRGEHMEITTWIEAALTSEMSGQHRRSSARSARFNSKPYEYRARTWELKQDRVDRCARRGRLQHPASTRAAARSCASSRACNEDGERGMDLGQDTLRQCDGLKKPPARHADGQRATGKLQPTGWREAFAAIKQRGWRAWRSGQDRVHRLAIWSIARRWTVLKRPDDQRLGTPNVDCRQDGAKLGGRAARQLPVQLDDRRDRASGRCAC